MAIGLATATQQSEADTLVQTFGVLRFHTSAVREDTYSEATIIPKVLESDNMIIFQFTDQKDHSFFIPTHDISAKREPYT
ncbi:hypothetical protein BGZ47_003483 [Haplosporangium gracile]|nr:hypothetical protein BGZ47_003483 [Haplosporangium gracile]